MEPDMLLHLPIAVMATFSPIPVADTVPTFDIVKECRYEGGSAANVDQCSRDETTAFPELKKEWAQSSGTNQKTCMATTTIGGFASYVELLTCLEMANNVVSSSSNPNDPPVRSRPQPTQPGRPSETVAEVSRQKSK
jgi:hypothetical protein